MKNNPLTGVLMALLFLSTAATVWRIYEYEQTFRREEQVKFECEKINAIGTVMNSLLNEANEYERTTRNAEMSHILSSLQGGPKTAPAAPAKPTR